VSRLQAASIAAAAGALAVAAYLTWTTARGVAPVCLAGSGGCETVARSGYTHVFGIPLSAFGIAGAAAALALAAWRSAALRAAGFAVALGGLVASVYLTGVEITVIAATCQWCLLSAALWTALAVVEAARLRRAIAAAPVPVRPARHTPSAAASPEEGGPGIGGGSLLGAPAAWAAELE